MRCLVVGLGNPILGDDGVGWRVADAVEQRLERSTTTVAVERAAVGGLSLMERLIGYDRAVVVDAVHTGQHPDGTVTTCQIDDLPDLTAGYSSSAHDTSLPTALRIGRALDATLPREVTIVAVEISNRYSFSEQLTPSVAAAVPTAAAAVLAVLGPIQPLEEDTMVSPELLRRYELFGVLSAEHLNAIAMLTEEHSFEPGYTIIEADKPADALYLLMEGSVDLIYVGADEIHPDLRKELFISEINPGEPFGISALVDPYRYMGSVRVTATARVLKVEAAGLRALCKVDDKIAAALMTQVAKAALARLHNTEVQLGAARV